MSIRILFFHGLESGPHGSKVAHMREQADFAVTAPELPTAPLRAFLAEHAGQAPPSAVLQPALAVAIAAINEQRPDILVGSSYGGGLALAVLAAGGFDGPVVLLAPAGRKLFAVAAVPPRSARVLVLHGRQDDVVPLQDSLLLAANSGCDVTVRVVEDDHRLHRSVTLGLLDAAIRELAVARTP